MFEMTEPDFPYNQIPADSPGWAYKFTGIEALQKQGLEVKASDYECVYSGQMLPSDNLDHFIQYVQRQLSGGTLNPILFLSVM